MTGYGKARSQSRDKKAWVVECSSVNRKSLELQYNAPRALLAYEPIVRRLVAQRFHRGRITVLISEDGGTDNDAGSLDRAAVHAAAEELRSLQKELSLPGEVTLEVILQHPLIARNELPGVISEETWAEIEELIGHACDRLQEMRGQEGGELEKTFRMMHTELSTIVQRISELAPQVPVKHREQLLARLEQQGLRELPDAGRLAAEVALFAERCDISEELARIESHLRQFAETLGAPGAIGRKLEFLTQELLREMNTTGSKASDAQISELVVEAKTLLDRIREQLANVE